METLFESPEWSRQSEALRRMARALVRDASAADDAVQNAWLSALSRPPERFSFAWFRRVVRSRAIDGRRVRERRREASIHELGEDQHPASDDLFERLEVHRVVAGAVQQLSMDYRRVVYLRYFEGLPPMEIAQRLGLPVKTVKTRLARALTQLRERLGRRYGDERGGWVPWIAATFLPRESGALPLAGGAGVAGGLGIMWKKIALAAGLLVASFGAYRFWPAGAEAEASVALPESDAPVVESVVEVEPAPAQEEPERTAAAVAEVVEPPPPATSGGVVIVDVAWSDGSAAGGVFVHLRRNANGRPIDGIDFAPTDAHGVARFDGVPPGPVTVGADRLDAYHFDDYRLDVVEGREVELDIQLPAGLTVEGRVVDGGGRAVAGAGIWLTTGFGDWTGGHTVATAEEDGSFRLRDVLVGQSLGALAPGFAPSNLLDLGTIDTSGVPVRVELVLDRPGGGLRGVVTGPDGAPAAGALVTAGKYAAPRSLMGGDQNERWTPRSTRTNVNGEYELRGLRPGEVPLRARSTESPIAKSRAEVVAGEVVRADMRLAAGVVVEGVVRDDTGEPVAGAIVRAFDEPIDKHFLQGGQYDYDDPLGYPSTEAGGDGRYRLERIPPGEVHLFANAPWSEYERRTSKQRAEAVLTAADGERIPWDAVLSDGRVIEGLVTYRDGTPMPHVFVTARAGRDGATQALVSDDEGRFRFLSMADDVYSIGVQLLAAPPDAKPLGVTGVRPDGGLVHLTASFDPTSDDEPGTVTGSLHDAGERATGARELSVQLESDRGFIRVWVELDGTDFRFPEVEPGRYRPLVTAGGDPVAIGEWFELAEGEERDLGVLTTERGGSLRLFAPRDLNTEDVELRIFVRNGDTMSSRAIPLGRRAELLADNLTPGELDVRVYGIGIASIFERVTIEADREATLRLDLVPAVQRPLSIDWPAGDPLESLSVRVEDAAGEVVWDTNQPHVGNLERPWVVAPQFPLGTYRVTATTGSGLAGTTTFEVRDLRPVEEPTRIVLQCD